MNRIRKLIQVARYILSPSYGYIFVAGKKGDVLRVARLELPRGSSMFVNGMTIELEIPPRQQESAGE